MGILNMSNISDTPSESTSLRQSAAPTARKRINCCSNWDGFTIISISFFMLTIAVTFALILQICYGSPEVTPHGAVATDERLCSEVGITIMRQGGSAIDVVVASLLCLSVTHPHLVGPGGGGLILVHDHKKNFSKVFDFMTGVPDSLKYPRTLDSNDGRSIGVPGFLRGLEKVHHEYGVIPWKKLFEPSIALARDGFNVSDQLAKEVSKENPNGDSSIFNRVFIPKGILIAKGQKITRIKYAQFLEEVSVKGADAFYLLKYGSEIMEALNRAGSLVSVEDFRNYKTIERNVLLAKLKKYDLITAGLPFGGLQVVAGLNYLNRSKVDLATSQNILYEEFAKAQRYGAMKLAEAAEMDSDLQDPLQQVLRNDIDLPDEPWILPNLPSAQVSTVDAFDFYATAIVGLGTSFGSRVMTEHEIILNNHLFADLTQTNVRKSDSHQFLRPFNSYSPFIIMDKENVCGKRVILSSGSSTALVQVVGQFLFRSHDMTSSIVEPRIVLGKPDGTLLVNDFHHGVDLLSGEVRQHLQGQNYTISGLYIPMSVNGVSKMKDSLVSHSDTRGGGVAARLSGLYETNAVNKTFVKTSSPSNVATLTIPSDGT